MPDVFLRQGEPNPDDVRLKDPTTSGVLAITGTGASSFPAPVLSGSGILRFVATGATSFLGPALTGSGILAFKATGASTFPALVLSGSGRLAFRATGAETFLGPALSGSGLLRVIATGATTIQPLLLTGNGTLTFVYSGSGAATMPPPLLSGSGVGPAAPEWHKILGRGVGVAGFQQVAIQRMHLAAEGNTEFGAPRLAGRGVVTENEDWVVDDDLLVLTR